MSELADQVRLLETERDALASRLRTAETVRTALARHAGQLTSERDALRERVRVLEALEHTAPSRAVPSAVSPPVPADPALAQARRQLRQQARELDRLQGWLETAGRDLEAVLGSWRWRLGDRLVRLAEILLWRSRGPLAMEHLRAILAEARRWRSVRRDWAALPPETPDPAADDLEPSRRSLVQPLPAVLPEPARQAGLSILVLNRNGAALLEQLLGSLQRHPPALPHEILVVDHASTDRSLRVLERWARTLPLRILARTENRSYAESNNAAAREARHAHLLLLNNDIVLTDPALIETGLRALQDPAIGVAGVRLFHPPAADRGGGALQHAGIRFQADPQYGFHRPVNLTREPGPEPDAPAWRVPAVTAAALFCRRDEFLALGGFHEGYRYGYEDVDLGLTYRQQRGQLSVLLGGVSAIHDESASQRRDPSGAVRARRAANIAVFKARFGYALRRRIRADRFSPAPEWTDTPPTVGFAVTEARPDTAAGDYFTALELAGALRAECGWESRFLPLRDRERDAHDLTGIDLLIVMIDNYDLSAVRNARPGLIRVAWLRNWFERWAGRPWFADYDLFLCASRRAADYLRDTHGKPAGVLRIACNPERFHPPADESGMDADYCFTGSHWNVEREIAALDPARLPWRFALYGQGWDRHPRFRPYWRGFRPYAELPAVYRRTRLLVDDANHVTKPWASVNSRVFDALASGVLTLTNGAAGAAEVFGDRLPTYDGPESLADQLGYWLEHPDARRARAAELRELVLARHTYAHRARELRAQLGVWSRDGYRFAIKVPAPDPATVQEWGDYHFALGLRRALTRLGHGVRIDLLPDWQGPHTFDDDVALVLRGLSVYDPQPDQLNLMWNISHPERVTDDEYARYDQVFVASRSWAGTLGARLPVPVTVLPQCTDPALFHPDPDPGAPAHAVLFVGNSRKQFRPIVRHALEAGLPLAVYGTRWEGLIPASARRGEHIPNDRLRQYYSRCGVLLNDHWPDMRDAGFLSNRLFDAAACGALAVSDRVADLDELFGDTVLTYDGTPTGLKTQVERLLRSAPETLAERRAAARERILAAHTFDHRAAVILEAVRALDAVRGLPE